ncbi:MAG: hypothetical protein M1497_02095 [Nitrospirae bacterium]|nr:hypothetical protein [Nitrospirota bacterium]
MKKNKKKSGTENNTGTKAGSSTVQKKTEVKITAAKGRPMLTWVGKRPLSHVTAFPAQHVESFSISPSPLDGEGGREEVAIWKDWPSSYPKGTKPKIDDWRAMVDCVMIDAAYDGAVFNVALSDVPEKRSDLVRGMYELPAPGGETTVAVKIIDMLGEEVLTIKKV